MIWTPGIGEWIIILVIVLLFTGAKKLPGLARSLGSGINEFKKGLYGHSEISEEDTPVSNKKISPSKSSTKKRKKA